MRTCTRATPAGGLTRSGPHSGRPDAPRRLDAACGIDNPRSGADNETDRRHRLPRRSKLLVSPGRVDPRLPTSVRTSRPMATSQSFTTSSAPPVASRAPFGGKAAACSGATWPDWTTSIGRVSEAAPAALAHAARTAAVTRRRPIAPAAGAWHCLSCGAGELNIDSRTRAPYGAQACSRAGPRFEHQWPPEPKATGSNPVSRAIQAARLPWLVCLGSGRSFSPPPSSSFGRPGGAGSAARGADPRRREGATSPLHLDGRGLPGRGSTRLASLSLISSVARSRCEMDAFFEGLARWR